MVVRPVKSTATRQRATTEERRAKHTESHNPNRYQARNRGQVGLRPADFEAGRNQEGARHEYPDGRIQQQTSPTDMHLGNRDLTVEILSEADGGLTVFGEIWTGNGSGFFDIERGDEGGRGFVSW